jgi:hypothetical protein
MLHGEPSTYKTQNAVECLFNNEYRDAAFGAGEAEEEEVDGDSDASLDRGAK